MNHLSSNRKKVTIAIALIAIITVSSGIYLQNNTTTQAALINPHPGQICWLNFNEGSGTVAADSSGNGNNGLVNGAGWVTGVSGNALSFPNNVANYVRVPNSGSLQVTGDLTINCWVKITTLSKQALVYKYWGGEFALYLQPNGGVTFAQKSLETYVISPGSVATDVWAQISVTRNATSKVVTGYINGAASLSSSYSVVPTSTSRDVFIGVEDAAYNPLNGIMDEVQIYNRALSPAEIKAYAQTNLDFSPYLTARVSAGTTQVIATLTWQGTGSVNATIMSPAQNYTENILPEYQKSSYSTTDGITSMLNIKRLSVSVTALPSDQNWYIALTFDNVNAYQITIETQK